MTVPFGKAIQRNSLETLLNEPDQIDPSEADELWGQLFKQVRDIVEQRCRTMLKGHYAEPDDVAQEVLTRLSNRVRSLEQNLKSADQITPIRSVPAFVSDMARNICINLLTIKDWRQRYGQATEELTLWGARTRSPGLTWSFRRLVRIRGSGRGGRFGV